MTERNKPLFEPGQLVITANAKAKLDPMSVLFALRKHQTGDWGKLDAHDKKVNEDALKTGGRLMSVYEDLNQVKYWIITEADRSVTTVLLPEDY